MWLTCWQVSSTKGTFLPMHRKTVIRKFLRTLSLTKQYPTKQKREWKKTAAAKPYDTTGNLSLTASTANTQVAPSNGKPTTDSHNNVLQQKTQIISTKINTHKSKYYLVIANHRTNLPQIPKGHNVIFKSECCSYGNQENNKVENNCTAHWADETPHHRFIQRKPTAGK